MTSYNDTIAVSGGFDPIHPGHVRMINAAAAYGRVIVILNSDDWLYRKKGYVFMSFNERREILESLGSVYRVEAVNDADNSVCEALRRLKPMMFGNGGDRTPTTTPEQELCNKLDIELIWKLGRGGKIQSSSELVENAGLNKL